MKFLLMGILCLLMFFGTLYCRAVERELGSLPDRVKRSKRVYHIVSSVSVREVTQDDLQKVCAVDKEVSFEHFLAVYQDISKVNKLPEPAEKLLRDELEADIRVFQDAVNHRGIYRLFAAFDEETGECCGFSLLSTKNDKEVTLDLLLICAAFRGKGVGKELVKYALAKHYPSASKCMVYPFKHGNEGAIKFYERLGFKKLGDGPKGHPCVLGKFEDVYYAYELALQC